MPTSDERVRVVIADDHPFFRDGVRRGLADDGRIRRVVPFWEPLPPVPDGWPDELATRSPVD